MKRYVVSGVWCVGLLFTAPLWLRAQDLIGIPVGQSPPAVTLESLDGFRIPLSRWIAKKPVVVEFWATWCPICEELFPRMEAAQRKYGDRVEFIVVAVAVNQTKNSVRRHLLKHPMPFIVLWDADGAAVRAFQAPSTSYIAVLDAQGKVVYTGVGEDQNIEAAIETAFAAPSPPPRRPSPP